MNILEALTACKAGSKVALRSWMGAAWLTHDASGYALTTVGGKPEPLTDFTVEMVESQDWCIA